MREMEGQVVAAVGLRDGDEGMRGGRGLVADEVAERGRVADFSYLFLVRF